MTDSPRRDGNEPTQQLGHPVDYPDPAYANQTPYNGTYPPAPTPPQPTQQMPAYPPYGYDPYGTGQYGAGQPGSGQHGGYPPPPGQPPQQEPEDREPRLWLWVLAALAVLVVVGLVIALVIANGSRQETVVAPPVSPQPSFSAPPTTSPSRTPRPAPVPPTRTSPPTGTVTPGATETVVYEVSGEGRAINITYLDTGGMLQTEFNVLLPWSKQVELAEPAKETASVSVLNFGPEVSCTVTVDGVQTQHRTGSGLTICVGAQR